MSKCNCLDTQREIIDYDVLEGRPLELKTKINQKIKEGYTLHGSIMQYETSSNHVVFVQAVILYQKGK